MTQKQKDNLSLHVALHKPIAHRDNAEIYWLNDNEIIEFTNFEYYSQNVKIEINHDKFRKIWFSQLTEFFLTDDLEWFFSAICFKGEEGKLMKDYEMNDLCNRLKNKKFIVVVDNSAKYVFNKKSDLWNSIPLITYQDACDHIRKCIANNKISEIGTLLKTANCYHLSEI